MTPAKTAPAKAAAKKAAPARQDEEPARAEKRLLNPEERRQAVRDARKRLVDAVFLDERGRVRKFEYIGPKSLPEDKRYTDPSGNKGRHGHLIREIKTGEEIMVGPSSLKKLAEEYKGIKLPKPDRKVGAAKA